VLVLPFADPRSGRLQLLFVVPLRLASLVERVSFVCLASGNGRFERWQRGGAREEHCNLVTNTRAKRQQGITSAAYCRLQILVLIACSSLFVLPSRLFLLEARSRDGILRMPLLPLFVIPARPGL